MRNRNREVQARRRFSGFLSSPLLPRPSPHLRSSGWAPLPTPWPPHPRQFFCSAPRGSCACASQRHSRLPFAIWWTDGFLSTGGQRRPPPTHPPPSPLLQLTELRRHTAACRSLYNGSNPMRLPSMLRLWPPGPARGVSQVPWMLSSTTLLRSLVAKRLVPASAKSTAASGRNPIDLYSH